MAQSPADEVALPAARAGTGGLRLAPSLLALLVLFALVGAYVLTAFTLGGSDRLSDTGSLFHLDRYLTMNRCICSAKVAY